MPYTGLCPLMGRQDRIAKPFLNIVLKLSGEENEEQEVRKNGNLIS